MRRDAFASVTAGVGLRDAGRTRRWDAQAFRRLDPSPGDKRHIDSKKDNLSNYRKLADESEPARKVPE